MRVLYVTHGFPYPLTRGYLRHYFLIRELSRQHAISLLSIVRADFDARHVEAMAPITERVMTFAAEDKSRSRLRRTLSHTRILAGREPAVRRLCAAVRHLRSKERFDVVLLSSKNVAAVMRLVDDLPVVVDLCDATSVRVRGRIRYCSPVRSMPLWAEYLRVRRAEKQMIRQADCLLFASARDREALIDGSGSRAKVVPNGVDFDFWKRASRVRGENTIVFTGGMDYPPNTDAAL